MASFHIDESPKETDAPGGTVRTASESPQFRSSPNRHPAEPVGAAEAGGARQADARRDAPSVSSSAELQHFPERDTRRADHTLTAADSTFPDRWGSFRPAPGTHGDRRVAKHTNPRMQIRYLGLLLPLLLLGCDSDRGSDRFRLVADVQQLMEAIIEPAAEVYWDAVGWVDEPATTIEIRPTTDEEWEEVVNAAYVVAESGNLLMMEGRTMSGPWVPMSQTMIEVARRAIAAAEARDEAAVFDVGAELYYACTACHSQYAVEAVRPNVLIQ
jgi:hypothetical protein